MKINQTAESMPQPLSLLPVHFTGRLRRQQASTLSHEASGVRPVRRGCRTWLIILAGVVILAVVIAQALQNRRKAEARPPTCAEKLAMTTPETVAIPATLEQYQIVFTSARAGGRDVLLLMNADGSHQRQISSDSFDAYSPSGSPDGRRLAFVRTPPAIAQTYESDIYVMDVDSGNLTRLTDFASGTPLGPVWSPDGEHIAFTVLFGSFDRGYHELFLMNADGSNPHQIADPLMSSAFGPVWSPDGQSLIFSFQYSRAGYSHRGLYRLDIDSNQLTLLTPPTLDSYAPVWSPDGQRLAIAVHSANPDAPAHPISEIYLMDANGDNITQLTSHSAFSASPAWSPDGQKIAYFVQPERGLGHVKIAIMTTDGKLIMRLPVAGRSGPELAWSPDGQYILFSAAQDQDIHANAIWLWPIHNQAAHQLTHDCHSNWGPVWVLKQR